MLKNLFTKHDHRIVPGITKEQAVQAASWYWRSRQFGIAFTSPYSLQGSQFYSKLGLRQSIGVYAMDEGPNVAVDLTFSAELTDEGAVVGVLGAVLLLPVTVAVGAVSYIEYDNDAVRLMNDFWSYLYSFPGNPQPPPTAPPPSWATQAPPQQAPVAPPAAPTPAPAPQQRTCPTCGVAIDSDSRFCKSCGARLS